MKKLKRFKIRMSSTCGYGSSSLEREVAGDFHKVNSSGDLSVFRDSSEVLLVVSGEWLEVNITKIPEKKKEVTSVTGSMGIDIETELLHAELKHADVFDAFQKSGRELADGIGDGAVATNIMKMIRKKWEDREEIDVRTETEIDNDEMLDVIRNHRGH
jgi:hypothetical protein